MNRLSIEQQRKRKFEHKGTIQLCHTSNQRFMSFSDSFSLTKDEELLCFSKTTKSCYPNVTPPSSGNRAAHKTRLCASKITQGFQKRRATDAARSCHTTWKTTKDRETSRLTILSKIQSAGALSDP